MKPDHDATRTADPSTAIGDAVNALRDLLTQSAATTAGVSSSAGVPDLPPGFVLEKEIGVGGMGVVYLARQAGLNRPVALKLVKHAEKVDAKALIRFLAEAEAVAAVRHPNVVEVYQYGDHQGRPYLALEYCPGGDLTTLTKAEQTRDANWFRRVADLMSKVSDGVQAAHALGIVHRDLKPHNVFLTADGTPKVADFGLAKRGLGSDLTNTEAVMGTPAYMSPEQAGGGTKFVGPEADVWALGVMLYELCCGERPIDTSVPVMDALARVAYGEVSLLRTKAPTVPPDLALIAHKCLSRDPRDRYPTAGGLATDLRNWLDGKPISARRAGVVEQAAKWARRNPAVAGLLAAVLIVFAAGAGVATYYATEEAKQSKEARENAKRAGDREREANDERDKVRAEQERIRGLLYVSQMNHASVAFAEGRIPRLVELLEETKPRPGEPDLCGWEWHYLDRLTRPPSQAFTLDVHSPPEDDRGIQWAFSADGRRLLRNTNPGVLQVWDGASGDLVGPRISVNGRTPAGDTPKLQLAAGADDVSWVDGRIALPAALSTDGTHVGAFHWDPHAGEFHRDVVVEEGVELLSGDEGAPARYRLRIWEVATGKEMPGPPIRTERLYRAGRVSPRSVLTVGPGADWAVWLECETVPQVLGFGLPLAIPRRGWGLAELLPVESPVLTLARWDRRTGRVSRTRFEPGAGQLTDLYAVSPGGMAVFVSKATGLPPLTNPTASVSPPPFKPGQIECWDLASDPPRLTRTIPVDPQKSGTWVPTLVVSPGGKRVAVHRKPNMGGETAVGTVTVYSTDLEKGPRSGPGRPDLDQTVVSLDVLQPSGFGLTAVSDGGRVVTVEPHRLRVSSGTAAGNPWASGPPATFYHRESQGVTQFGAQDTTLLTININLTRPVVRVWDVSRDPGRERAPAHGKGKLSADGAVAVEWGGPGASEGQPANPVVIKSQVPAATLGRIDPPAGGSIESVEFVAGGRRVLVVTKRPKMDAKPGGVASPWGAGVEFSREWAIHDLDGRRLAGGTAPTWLGVSRRWLTQGYGEIEFVTRDALTGAPNPPITGLPGSVVRTKFDAHEDHVLVVTEAGDGPAEAPTAIVYRARLFEVATGRPVWGSWVTVHTTGAEVVGETSTIVQGIIDADGYAADSNLQAEFTEDGRVLIGPPVGQPSQIWVGKAADGAPERTLCPAVGMPIEFPMRSFWLDRASGRLAVHGFKQVEVFDLGTGSSLWRLRGHDGPILSVTFTPDGSRVFTLDQGGPAENRLRVWDLANGGLILTLRVPRTAGGLEYPSLEFRDDVLRIPTTTGGKLLFDGRPVKR